MRTIIKIAIILLYISCDNPTRNNTVVSIPYHVNVRDITDYKIINFDTIALFFMDTTGFSEKYFSHIVFGKTKGYNNFVPMDTIYPDYSKIDDKFELNFTSVIHLKPYYSVFNCELRFHYSPTSYLSDFLNIETYKFPYSSSEIFLNTWDILMENIQDFYMFGNNIYFLPIGPPTISEYNLISQYFRELFYKGSGTLLTGNDSLLFYSDQFGISRFNLTSLNFDLEFDLKAHDIERITGMALDDDNLYTIAWQPGEEINLISFSLDGEIIDVQNYDRNTWYMAVHDSIIYSLKSTLGISRFDLKQNKFLETMVDPARGTQGIFVKYNYFYYSVYPKAIIAKVPLQDLKIQN